MLYTGGFFESFSLLEAVSNMNGMLALIYVVSISVIFSIIFYSVEKLSKVSDSTAAFIIETKSMFFVVILLAFACAMTFSTDASRDTYAIMIPLVIPLAFAMDISVYACIAAVI